MRTTITIPDKLSEEFDEAIKGHFQTRNEAIRAAMKNLIEQLSQGED